MNLIHPVHLTVEIHQELLILSSHFCVIVQTENSVIVWCKAYIFSSRSIKEASNGNNDNQLQHKFKMNFV